MDSIFAAVFSSVIKNGGVTALSVSFLTILLIMFIYKTILVPLKEDVSIIKKEHKDFKKDFDVSFSQHTEHAKQASADISHTKDEVTKLSAILHMFSMQNSNIGLK